MFNSQDWYWLIGSSPTQTYSSARNAYVPLSDSDYNAWLHGGNVATVIDAEINIWPYVSDDVPSWMLIDGTFARPSPSTWTKAQLKAYAALLRFNKETGGVAINGVTYPTDLETQSKMTAAVLLAQVNPATNFKWKLADGTFTPTIDATEMVAIASAVGSFVNGTFAQEEIIDGDIDAETITTLTQVAAAFG